MRERNGCKAKNKIIKLVLIIIVTIILVVTVTIALSIKWNNESKLASSDDEILIQEIKNDEYKIENDEKTDRIKKLEELQNANSDIVALLEIEGSSINYPVLQTTDNSYYMTHNYKKEESKDGSLFLDKDYDWNLPSTNLLIYGHNNIGSQEMFAGLMNYKDEEYYKTHKTIKFTTNQEDAEYEIIAVFLSRVYYKSEKNVFRYYFFINAENEHEFNAYVENSKKASLYQIDATAKYGDQLLTLSTCSYHTEDGRLAVVARKLPPH